MAGVGLGTYLYAAAARTVHRLGGSLFSTEEPAQTALENWQRMVTAGWAQKGPEKNLSSYRFDFGLLESGFFNSLDAKVSDPDDLFLLFADGL